MKANVNIGDDKESFRRVVTQLLQYVGYGFEGLTVATCSRSRS